MSENTEQSNAKWYVIHTYSGYENKVKDNLEKAIENRKMHDLIQEIMVPVEDVLEIKNNRKKLVQRKIFPGYVLVKMIMTDDSWYVVRNTRGVTGFVGPGSKPIPLTDEEVRKMGVESVHIKIDVAVGQNVRVISGPLEGFVGTVMDVDTARQKIKVQVSMFGRDTPVELDFAQIERHS
ncbi:MAG TPA: transcription termination/antitermination protein NusG [Clostridia bacterium]|nr:transcription termination/antitermination protein NusG [Clostridia bacterium]